MIFGKKGATVQLFCIGASAGQRISGVFLGWCGGVWEGVLHVGGAHVAFPLVREVRERIMRRY